MPSKIVNLTAYIVVESIKNILEDCLEYPYQMMFSVSYYRQRLIAQTLSSIKNSYVVIQDTEELDELDVVRLHMFL
ncbi:hypothetical protein IQ241_10930 [Romeria aff. gracilis LEGE 07310]|uniref:Uncharacterized protein n=1 Tax=Vasconcelosia minhoensis LEGE 07310 TaxID=915328 RepID=A0A8J7ACT1_9CYAN|nr:hypothetical protein [Romeria gracilis]MBE9077801.1 hypothetical protein [Romeria aff. gracilis LEGE 07310]